MLLGGNGFGINGDINARKLQAANAIAEIGEPRRFARAAGLNQNMIGWRIDSGKLLQLLQRVVLQLAAGAAIGQRDGVAIMFGNQTGIDIHRAEIIDQHSQALSMRARQKPIDERRLACAQIAAENG